MRSSGDPRLLRVALENLLGNAWKFTAQDGGRTDRRRLLSARRLARPTSCATTAPGSTWRTPQSCSAPFQRLHARGRVPGHGRRARDGAADHRAARRRDLGRGEPGQGRHVLLHAAERRRGDAMTATRRSSSSRTTADDAELTMLAFKQNKSATRSSGCRTAPRRSTTSWARARTPPRRPAAAGARAARPEAAQGRRARGAAADARRSAHAPDAGRHPDVVAPRSATSSRATASARTATCASRSTSPSSSRPRQLGVYWLVTNTPAPR